tara:strand:- start:483 stop:872 length:390 start_codon:yes stop_codon:yes gene_type:complete
MSEYAQHAKKLLSVCTRLERWFTGEKLYEAVQSESTDGSKVFRWNFRSGKFEYMEEESDRWKKVVQAHNPVIMAEFMTVLPQLHQLAKDRKNVVADTLYAASEAGEEYLQRISGFVIDDLSELETADDE